MTKNRLYAHYVSRWADAIEELGVLLIHVRALHKAFPKVHKFPYRDGSSTFEREEFDKASREIAENLPRLTTKSIDKLLGTGLPGSNISSDDGYGHNEKCLDEYAWACFAVRSVLKGLSKAIQKTDKKELEAFSEKMAVISERVLDILMFGPELAGYWTCEFDHKQKDHRRTTKSTEALRAKKEKEKTTILQAFYQAPNLDKVTKPHTKAKVIRQYLGKYKKPVDIRSLNTIKNYLREAKLI